MIGSLKGTIDEIEPLGESALELVVDVAGVGYRVVVGPRQAAVLGAVGSPVALSIHTHVREGAITLYGFVESLERKTFELLITAHGVGPALALAILGAHSPSSLAQAVGSGDVDALMVVPGVGRKTAQRLVVELSQRLDVIPEQQGGLNAAGSAHGEVRSALVALGYGPDEVRSALDILPGEGSVETLLRDALRALAPRS